MINDLGGLRRNTGNVFFSSFDFGFEGLLESSCDESWRSSNKSSFLNAPPSSLSSNSVIGVLVARSSSAAPLGASHFADLSSLLTCLGIFQKQTSRAVQGGVTSSSLSLRGEPGVR